MTQTALIIGATGGVGRALADVLEARGAHERVVRLSRQPDPAVDVCDEASIARARAAIAVRRSSLSVPVGAAGGCSDVA